MRDIVWPAGSHTRPALQQRGAGGSHSLGDRFLTQSSPARRNDPSQPYSRLRLGCLAVIAAVSALLAGCAPDRYRAVPSALASDLTIAHVENARSVGDDVAGLHMELERAVARRREQARRNEPITFLALSGGQEDGAFGAGLLVGWSQHGGRPKFQIVTGTSTGALAAPFAFLGPDYDWAIEAMYTRTVADDVAQSRYLVEAVSNDALMDTKPLARTIAKYVSERILQLIAEEYRKGRLLLISTTNLDSGKPVIWNIGAIAASDNPDRLSLVRTIILASASVPGMFPPVMIDAKLNDGRYQEMHVDGGTVSQMFLYPPSLDMAAIIGPTAKTSRPVAYVIRNGRVGPEPEEVERGALPIAGRAIATMIASNGVGALYRIYATTQRDHIAFKLALIDDDFKVPYRRQFDSDYMNKLFAYGLAKGAAGYAWQKAPPGFVPASR